MLQTYSLLTLFLVTLFHPVTSRTTGTATGTIPFAPLFRKPPTARYIFDALTSDDVIVRDRVEPNQGTPLPRSESKYWVEYDETDAILDGQTFAYTDLAYTFAGRRGVVLPNPSGTFNGCEGSLGLDCSNAVVDALRTSLSKVVSLYFAGQRLQIDYIRNLATNTTIKNSCPAGIFDDFGMASYAKEKAATIAHEEGNIVGLYPAGNFSAPMTNIIFTGFTASQELNQIIVTMMTRAPIDIQARKDTSKIQVEIMCMRAVEGSIQPTYSPTLDPTRSSPSQTSSGVGSATQTSSAGGVAGGMTGLTMLSGLVSFLFGFL